MKKHIGRAKDPPLPYGCFYAGLLIFNAYEQIFFT
jgi:hypothetical protein